MPASLTRETFGFLYAEVQQQMFSKDSKHMKQNDLNSKPITVSQPGPRPFPGKRENLPSHQNPGPRMDGSAEQGLGCRLSGFTGPSLHPVLLPAALPPYFTAARPATPSVKTAVILHPPPAASSTTRKNVLRTTNNHTIYQHNKQTC